ncbi:hypothetical protein [Planctomicrobium sp. SH527]|uniref:hypothetical protein n=1 Tax=Planctomicrobium sp. SH527 TaxID=3448123 RepID=UPI003F5B1F84
MPQPYRAIYTYPWDLAEYGVNSAITEFCRLGLNTVTVCGTYHAGKFLRPLGKHGKVYFPCDGAAYFHTNSSFYGTIKPHPSPTLAERDVLRELTESKEIQTNAWLVLLHNTRLGERYPDACAQNAFGDKYFYSLSPSHPAAREYAIGLATDITSNYAVSGISLESPGFAPYFHGFHHEFSLVRHNRWLDNLLGLDFSPSSVERGKASGIDVERLKDQVARDITAYLESDVDFPDDMAEAFWLADVQSNGDLRRYLDFRCQEVTSLVKEIRDAVRVDATVAVIPSVARPTAGAWYEGSDLPALMKATGVLEACFYESSAARVKSDLFDIQRRLRGEGKLRAILRPSHPDLSTRDELLSAVHALHRNGIEDFAFYNWGHLRRQNVEWIGDALRSIL